VPETVRLDGQVIVIGMGTYGLTITLNEQLETLPQELDILQVTGEVPTANEEPLGGEHVMVTGGQVANPPGAINTSVTPSGLVAVNSIPTGQSILVGAEHTLVRTLKFMPAL
jgi:hypothetical protein